MENKTKSLLFNSMNYGLYLGIIMIIFTLLLFLLDWKPIGFKATYISIISLVITIFAIVYATKKIRNEVLGGELTFAQGLLIGLIVVFVSSVLSSIYTYIQTTIIDPDYMKNFLESQKTWMEEFMVNKGIPDDQIEKSIEMMEEKMANMNPIKTMFTSILSSTVFGLIISLITAAILKKKNDNPFTNNQVIE